MKLFNLTNPLNPKIYVLTIMDQKLLRFSNLKWKFLLFVCVFVRFEQFSYLCLFDEFLTLRSQKRPDRFSKAELLSKDYVQEYLEKLCFRCL